MDDENEKKGFWKSWMTIAVLVALTIMVFIFNSQGPSIRTEPNKNLSIENSSNVVGSNTSIKDNNISIMDNDTYFKNMVNVNLKVIYENLKCISRAGQTQNFSATEICAKFLRESSNLSLNRISEYNVSSSIQVAMDEYKNALEYYNIGATKLEIGARDRNSSQMSDAIGYIQNGTMYVDKATLILYGGNTYNVTSGTTPNATFVHPKIGNTST